MAFSKKWPTCLIFYLEDEYDKYDHYDQDEGIPFLNAQFLNICIYFRSSICIDDN